MGEILHREAPADADLVIEAVAERLEAELTRALEAGQTDREGELQCGKHTQLCCDWHKRFLSGPGLREPI